MFYYITYLYNTIRKCLHLDTESSKYMIPFKIQNNSEIKKDDDFQLFKDNDIEINKVIFTLNNLPDKVHSLLFRENSEICSEYFHVTIQLQYKEIKNISHNLANLSSHLTDNSIRYVFIRVNVIDASHKLMDHVNCIIIDKKKKYILFFEPKFDFMYDVNDLTLFIDKTVDIKDYSKIFPKDIGYSYYNRLQSYDIFCQSYVIFVFSVIINNDIDDVGSYATILNNIITHENLGYMLYYINTLLKESGYDICEQKILWSFPTKKTQNILNIMRLYFNNYNKKITDNTINNMIEDTDIDLEMDEDFVIVNVKSTD